MNDLGSHELNPLDVMNRLGLWMIWTILLPKLKPLDAMNYSRLWTTYGDSELWSQCSRCYEKLKALAEINIFGSWAQGTKCSQQLKAMDDMTNSRL